MIHKFLIVGKQVYLSPIRVDNELENLMIVDLLMPLVAFWQAEELLSYAQYLTASNEHATDVYDVYRRVFVVASRYALFEKDRMWLIENSKSPQTQQLEGGGKQAAEQESNTPSSDTG